MKSKRRSTKNSQATDNTNNTTQSNNQKHPASKVKATSTKHIPANKKRNSRVMLLSIFVTIAVAFGALCLLPKSSSSHASADTTQLEDAIEQARNSVVKFAMPNIEKYVDLSTDERIIAIANEHLNKFHFQPEDTFSVANTGKASYIANVNGKLYPVSFPRPDDVVAPAPLDVKELDDAKLLGLLQSARDSLANYFRTSSLFKDNGEKLIADLSSIKVCVATLVGPDANRGAAMYNYMDDRIYINRPYMHLITEWMLIHEYLHAICERTTGGTKKMLYPFALLNEVITDIIVSQIKATPDWWKQVCNTGYYEYLAHANRYLGCVGMKGLEAYFYGYSTIYTLIPKQEFDLFVDAFDRLEVPEYFKNITDILNTCINKWGLAR